MNVCLRCKELFDEPKEIVETHGFEHPPYEHLYVCPCCGGDYVKTKRCSICDEYITNEYIITSDDDLICEECYTKKNIDSDGI